jgi:hypothetical protein
MKTLRTLIAGIAALVAVSGTSLQAQTTASKSAPAGYLFVTFRGQKDPMDEQVYFALSKDGKNWSALNDSKPVLVSQLGEKGVRDHYLLRSHDNKKFYLIATDLSWALSVPAVVPS